MSDDDRLAFFKARLDEDEAAAKAIAPLGYVFDMGGERLDDQFAHIRVRHHSEDGRSYSQPDQPATRHFARHDPARVLREVAAKRAIVAEYEGAERAAADDQYLSGLWFAIESLAAAWAEP